MNKGEGGERTPPPEVQIFCTFIRNDIEISLKKSPKQWKYHEKSVQIMNLFFGLYHIIICEHLKRFVLVLRHKNEALALPRAGVGEKWRSVEIYVLVPCSFNKFVSKSYQVGLIWISSEWGQKYQIEFFKEDSAKLTPIKQKIYIS